MATAEHVAKALFEQLESRNNADIAEELVHHPSLVTAYFFRMLSNSPKAGRDITMQNIISWMRSKMNMKPLDIRSDF